MPFGIRGIGSENLITKTKILISENIEAMNPRAIENWLFFMNRSATLNNERSKIIKSIISEIVSKNYIASGIIRDHLLILDVCNKY